MTQKTSRHVHLVLLIVWTVAGIPVSFWLRDSIAWLVFLSVYAIIASHWAGWSAEHGN